ncbi:742_t:CDS:2 [Paraglomus brasilianum]|uniref:742_t:CDS:1 n=1 Tax=Paraglomus brasilianum TaxID=144538 RepID=A0A9N9CU19_9GLOM|nr:742_t:CDS:2 [Paraglomus brasilianum]
MIGTKSWHSINTIDDAKKYSNYHRGALKPKERSIRSIFDSTLLKPNSTLDKAFLQDTAELLNVLKTSSKQIKSERMGLSKEATDLLIILLKNQKDILFAESDPEFDQKIEDKTIALVLGELLKREEEITKEIERLRKKCSTEIVKKQTDLRNRIVDALVPALKS